MLDKTEKRPKTGADNEDEDASMEDKDVADAGSGSEAEVQHLSETDEDAKASSAAIDNYRKQSPQISPSSADEGKDRKSTSDEGKPSRAATVHRDRQCPCCSQALS